MGVYGPGILLDYPQRLLDYGSLVSPDNPAGAQLRLVKYTDLQTAARLLGPPLETPVRIAAVPVALYFIVSLGRLWRRAQEGKKQGWNPDVQHAWAATLVLLPVLNFYFSVYDALIMIPGVLAAASMLIARTGGGPRAVLPAPFLGAVALVYLAGILSPTFQVTRVNLMTIALLVMGWYVLRRVPASRTEPTVV
jgi:hypothetical protein